MSGPPPAGLPERRSLLRAAYLTATLMAAASTASAGAQAVDPSYYAGMRWRSIGPYRSGNVYAVAGIPGDPTTYYIGTPEAGVWKTTDGGTVWTPIFDGQHVPSIGAVVVSASDPNVVYVGSGNPSGWSFTAGSGVYKSTDAGATWQKIGLDSTRYITAMILIPHRPDIVLVGSLGERESGIRANAASGIYRSTDGGHSWKHVLYQDPYTGVAAMSIDHADPAVIYAALERRSRGLSTAARDSLPPFGTGIYKSVDQGATWRPVSGQGLPPGAEGFEIATASGTHGRRVYAEAKTNGRDAGGLYRSDDGGQSWSLTTRQILSAGGGPIYVDPRNPDVIYLMGTAMYRSIDGGRHVTAYKGSPGGDDVRDLWIDSTNPRRMLMGVDQGPTITVDGGETWTPWYNLPNGQFYHVSTDEHFPYRVCAAQQDSGTACVLSRSDFGAIRDNDWYPVGGFEDGYIVTDPLNERWIFTQGWYHALRRYDRETGQVAVVYSPSPDDRFGNAPPLVFSPQDPHVLYMGAQYVLVSSDSGRDWRRISADLTARPGPSDTDRTPVFPPRRRVAIETLAPSPVSSGEIWVGTGNGVIQVTRNGGESWTNVTPPDLPQSDQVAVRIIDPSHVNAGTAYAAVEGAADEHPYIYRTTDFGEHWQLIVRGLPGDAAVRVVREDPADPDLLYAGTLMGAWVSFDRGDHWQSLQLNLPNTVITDMVVHDVDLAISTYGRALWILDDLTPLRQAHSAMASASPAYLFQPSVAYRVRWDNIQDTPLPPEVPAGDNPPEGAIIDYYLKSAAAGPVTLSLYDADDHLIRRYSSVAPAPDSSLPNIAGYWFAPPIVLQTAAGMHRVAWDLRYPDPAVVNYSYFGDLLDYTEYTLNTHAIKGLTPRIQPTGPLVVPGTFHIRLSVGGETYTRDLTVVNDPRVPVTQAALALQLRFELRMLAGMTVSFDAFNTLQQLRSALAKDEGAAAAPRSAQVLTALKALDTRASLLTNAPDGSGFGPANRDLTRHLEDMEFGDIAPTASDLAAAEPNCKKIDSALAGLEQLETTDIPKVNAMLADAHLTPLPTTAPSPPPGCGSP